MDPSSRPTLLERLSALLTRAPEDREELLELLHTSFERNLLGLCVVSFNITSDRVKAIKAAVDAARPGN